MFTENWNVVPGEVATATKFSQLGANDDYLKDAIDAAIQPGAMMIWPAATPPDGWLLCDGSAVSRSTYADLYAVLGTSRGAGDGSTTFNLPDLRGRTIVMLDTSQSEFNALGKQYGAKNVTLTTAQMPVHSHGVNDPGHAHYITSILDNYGGGSSNNALASYPGANVRITDRWTDARATGIWLSNAGSGQAHSNVQPSGVENIIIKF
jgi:microcystin-dependent protein